jgi:hypothetical protein
MEVTAFRVDDFEGPLAVGEDVDAGDLALVARSAGEMPGLSVVHRRRSCRQLHDGSQFLGVHRFLPARHLPSSLTVVVLTVIAGENWQIRASLGAGAGAQ